MYSCIVLALKLLVAFCPEAAPQHEHQAGWPNPHTLKLLQVSMPVNPFKFFQHQYAVYSVCLSSTAYVLRPFLGREVLAQHAVPKAIFT